MRGPAAGALAVRVRRALRTGTAGTAVAAQRVAMRAIDRLLRPLSKVRSGEGALAVLMLVCVFLILTSYYVMKTAR